MVFSNQSTFSLYWVYLHNKRNLSLYNFVIQFCFISTFLLSSKEPLFLLPPIPSPLPLSPSSYLLLSISFFIMTAPHQSTATQSNSVALTEYHLKIWIEWNVGPIRLISISDNCGSGGMVLRYELINGCIQLFNFRIQHLFFNLRE